MAVHSLSSSIIALVLKIVHILAKEEELPLCPIHVNYLPQNLPMHCRMPRSANYPIFPGILPNLTFPPLPPMFQNPSSDKQSAPIPIPMPPGLPGPGPAPMPMHLPMMPMPAPGPAPKLPVIVMPFYSPDGTRKLEPGKTGHYKQRKRRFHKKKRKSRYYFDNDRDSDMGSSETDTSRETSSDGSSSDSGAGRWGPRRSGRKRNAKKMHKRRHTSNKELLTPILQYVTKDGYVIFEKKINKNQANDWLQEKKEDNVRQYNEPPQDQRRDKEENAVAHEAGDVTADGDARRASDTKILGKLEKTDVRIYKNPHRRKSKKQSNNKVEKR